MKSAAFGERVRLSVSSVMESIIQFRNGFSDEVLIWQK
jgi:hypothetical protein